MRLRLTLLYGGVFLVAGAALLVITYLLVQRSTNAFVIFNRQPTPTSETAEPFVTRASPDELDNATAQPDAADSAAIQQAQRAYAAAIQQHETFLHQLRTQSAVALGVMAIAAVALGWLVAGRVLRPLRTMTTTAQRISEHSLHERLAIQGPGDEMKELADTIDSLLGRLETAFEAQRRFVANASHELRTPLTVERTLLEVTLADPHASASDLRATCQEILDSGAQQETLIDALLTLARSERGLDRWEHFDLAAVTAKIIDARRPDAQRHEHQIDVDLNPAPTAGNPDLAERLVANLVDNAICHNVKGGVIQVTTANRHDRATLAVVNSGQVVPPEDINRLFQPFQRLGTDRTNHPDRHGLGLSIVHAIAIAHNANLAAHPRPEGGLKVEVSFPIHQLHLALG
ncbi:MAG: sensor histidine kinase [Acidimicrobiales bacterium]